VLICSKTAYQSKLLFLCRVFKFNFSILFIVVGGVLVATFLRLPPLLLKVMSPSLRQGMCSKGLKLASVIDPDTS